MSFKPDLKYTSIRGSRFSKELKETYRIVLNLSELELSEEEGEEVCQQIDNLLMGYILNRGRE